MKKTNLIINGVLAAAVIALFVLHFIDEDDNSSEQSSTEHGAVAMQSGDLKIAYFNVDSVMNNWDMYFQVQEQLAARQSSLESEFENKTKAFQKRVEDAQYKIQRGLVTRAEAEQLQNQLGQEEQGLVALQNNFGMQLQEEGMVKNRQLVDQIEQYLKKFNETAGYTYIFSYTFGGNLLYGDEAYNITAEVIKGINEEYAVTGKE